MDWAAVKGHDELIVLETVMDVSVVVACRGAHGELVVPDRVMDVSVVVVANGIPPFCKLMHPPLMACSTMYLASHTLGMVLIDQLCGGMPW
jgi:hypothetical protein